MKRSLVAALFALAVAVPSAVLAAPPYHHYPPPRHRVVHHRPPPRHAPVHHVVHHYH